MMTTQPPSDKDAVERLIGRLRAYDHDKPSTVPSARGTRTVYPLVNPDGPAAADLLEALAHLTEPKEASFFEQTANSGLETFAPIQPTEQAVEYDTEAALSHAARLQAEETAEQTDDAVVNVSLEMVKAGEAEFRRRCGNALPEAVSDCEAAAIAIYAAMEKVR